MFRAMEEGVYTVKVSVDGVDVPDSNYCRKQSDCVFKVSLGYFRTWL